MAGVTLENVTKKHGDIVAVDNLTLQVDKGKLVCLLGPSGAGKTTTLKMIAGIETQDSGDIYIDDILVNHLAPRDRDIAMVFQSYALYPHRSVFENIGSPLKSRGVNEDHIRREIYRAAETLRIDHLLGRIPQQLSGGERQRVAIARAIVRDPKVYLFDEPLTNLDAKLREHMRYELRRIQRDLNSTAMFATPDFIEALAIADKIAVMRGGSLLQFDSPSSIYDFPRDKFVAWFVGAPAMNLLDCNLKSKNGAWIADLGEIQCNITHLQGKVGEEYLEHDVIFGIRPEHIVINESKRSEEAVEFKIVSVEKTKPDHILHLRRGSLVLVARCPEALASRLKEKTWARLDTAKVRLFDRKTGHLIV